jgi:Flp pilus assembly protein TadG
MMKKTAYNIAKRLQLFRYAAEERANAAIETVVLMPLVIGLLIGCYDIGMGILINQKTVGASQIIGDLITRDRSVTMTSLEDIIRAGELAYEPYSTTSFGYDIASIRFDADGDPVVIWRVTNNMAQNDDAVASTEGLGDANDGMVVVTTAYTYNPYFTHFVAGDIVMQEVAFLRGRRSATVTCNNCPSS